MAEKIKTVGYIHPTIVNASKKKLDQYGSNFDEVFYAKQLSEEQGSIKYYNTKPDSEKHIVEAYVPWDYVVYGDEQDDTTDYSFVLHTFYLTTFNKGKIIESKLLAKYLTGQISENIYKNTFLKNDYFKKQTADDGYELNKVNVVDANYVLFGISKNKDGFRYNLEVSKEAPATAPEPKKKAINVDSADAHYVTYTRFLDLILYETVKGYLV